MSEHKMLESDDRLSLKDQARLVEIAHETQDGEIKRAAMNILRHHTGPLAEPGMAYPIDPDTGTGKDSGVEMVQDSPQLVSARWCECHQLVDGQTGRGRKA